MNKVSLRTHSRPFSNHPVLCECLEPRVLLSSTPAGPVNLVLSNVAKLQLDQVLAGSSVKGSFQAIVAEDAGNATGSGAISVVAYLRPDVGGADILITPKAGKVTNIAADGSKSATLKYVLPTTLAAGNYALVVTADPGNTVT